MGRSLFVLLGADHTYSLGSGPSLWTLSSGVAIRPPIFDVPLSPLIIWLDTSLRSASTWWTTPSFCLTAENGCNAYALHTTLLVMRHYVIGTYTSIVVRSPAPHYVQLASLLIHRCCRSAHYVSHYVPSYLVATLLTTFPYALSSFVLHSSDCMLRTPSSACITLSIEHEHSHSPRWSFSATHYASSSSSLDVGPSLLPVLASLLRPSVVSVLEHPSLPFGFSAPVPPLKQESATSTHLCCCPQL